MPLTDAQEQQFDDWLRQHNFNRICPVCGAVQRWRPGEIINAPKLAPGGGFDLTSPSIPMVQMLCIECGYVMLFAAMKIGLMPGP